MPRPILTVPVFQVKFAVETFSLGLWIDARASPAHTRFHHDPGICRRN